MKMAGVAAAIALAVAAANAATRTATETYVQREVAAATNGLAGVAYVQREVAAATNGIATRADITNAVRSVAHSIADYVWDAESEICWRRQVSGGYIDYVAVTNIDLTAPQNAAALEAAEAARRAR